MRIGVDLMGGDTPPNQLATAVDKDCLVYTTADFPFDNAVICSTFISMDEDPLDAIKKKDSTLMRGLQDLKAGVIDAFVTVGNTGALVAGATLFLPKSVQRPGLLALLPTHKGQVAVIDVGANVSAKAHHLLDYAHLGAAYMRKRFSIQEPKVALLNIGTESMKGHPALKEAYQLLEQSDLHFVGNIEGTRAFHSDVDVIVTDGFTGNIFLKASEGTASFIFQEEGLKPRFDYEEYPGALLAGLDKIVIKCHGSSSPKALCNGIKGARDYLDL